jgi:dipeptidyl aminopeptidase/acylaminoacyl peptidase
MDENVHFAHTVQLIQALVKAGKPYQLNVRINLFFHTFLN